MVARDADVPRDSAPDRAVPCPNCSAQNRASSRFCMTCGHILDATSADAPGPTAPIAPMPMLAIGTAKGEAPTSSEAAPEAPSPAAGEALGAPADVLLRACPRCRGMCDASAAFCKFCGAALSDVSEAKNAATGDPGRPGAPARTSKPGLLATAPIAPAAPAARAAGPTPAPGLMNAGAPRPDAPLRKDDAPKVASAAAAPARRDASTQEAPGSLRTAAAPSSVAPARLVIIAKDGGEGQSFPLREGLDIGRSEGDVILSDDRYLSPRHARLVWRRDELVLRDLGSVNGVFLRLTKSQSPNMAQSLQDQDLILIGQQVIRFEIVKDAEEGLGPAMQHGTLLFGTPAAPRHARLCQRTVEGVTRDIFHVRKVETVLGRESGDIVFTEDPFLSRRHAIIKLDPVRKTFVVADLGSSNGTFLQIRGDAILRSGDEFRIGQQLFRVILPDGPRSGVGQQDWREPQKSAVVNSPKSVS